EEGEGLRGGKGDKGLAGIGALRSRCGRHGQEEHEGKYECVAHKVSPDLGQEWCRPCPPLAALYALQSRKRWNLRTRSLLQGDFIHESVHGGCRLARRRGAG